VLDQNLISKAPEDWQVPTDLGREYRYPRCCLYVTVVLVDQRDFFFFFLFILVKHSTSSLHIITTFGVNLGNHYRKRLNFRGPKTHENKRKPTKTGYFRLYFRRPWWPTKIAGGLHVFSSAFEQADENS
jgi:hypothetical protein